MGEIARAQIGATLSESYTTFRSGSLNSIGPIPKRLLVRIAHIEVSP